MIENVIATSISRNGFIKIISLLFVAMLINLRTYNDPGSLILKITFSLFDCKYKFFLGCEIKRVRDLDFFITNGGVWKFLLFFLFFFMEDTNLRDREQRKCTDVSVYCIVNDRIMNFLSLCLSLVWGRS